jgi:hypothetical protein
MQQNRETEHGYMQVALNTLDIAGAQTDAAAMKLPEQAQVICGAQYTMCCKDHSCHAGFNIISM